MGKMSVEVRPMINRMLLLVVLSFLGGSAIAQVTERVVIPSKKNIVDFDNTTFCVSFLADEQAWALRDVLITDVDGIDKVVFNPTGSSIALLSGKDEITIYSFRERNAKMFELKEKRKGLKDRENLP